MKTPADVETINRTYQHIEKINRSKKNARLFASTILLVIALGVINMPLLSVQTLALIILYVGTIWIWN
jgi:hypothetical protein